MTVCALALLTIAPQSVKAQKQNEGILLYEQKYPAELHTLLRADSTDQSLNWVKNPKTAPDKAWTPDLKIPQHYRNKRWTLVREKDRTVMHCYLLMPSYPCKDLWLGGEETFIVDARTGTHYQARGTYDKAIWGESFALRGVPAGTVLDFPIYFPPLPENVTQIYIYGVPRWASRGGVILDLYPDGQPPVETAVQWSDIRLPHLIEQRGPYNPDDMDTYDVYDDIHIIKPNKDGTMALWRTPEATYLGVACEMNWNREYFNFSSKTVLINERTRHMYKIRRIMGDIPMDRVFFINGLAGDWIAFLLEFEPMPIDEDEDGDVDTRDKISYSEPEAEPFHVWGSNWSATFKSGLAIKQLETNQKYFAPYERQVVK